jgi:hypothetical protein
MTRYAPHLHPTEGTLAHHLILNCLLLLLLLLLLGGRFWMACGGLGEWLFLRVLLL